LLFLLLAALYLKVRDNIQELVSYLYKINAFVVDIEALNGTQMHKNVNYLSRTYRAGFTYGIFNQSIQFEKFSVRKLQLNFLFGKQTSLQFSLCVIGAWLRYKPIQFGLFE
jgi:hypothetical protein